MNEKLDSALGLKWVRAVEMEQMHVVYKTHMGFRRPWRGDSKIIFYPGSWDRTLM